MFPMVGTSFQGMGTKPGGEGASSTARWRIGLGSLEVPGTRAVPATWDGRTQTPRSYQRCQDPVSPAWQVPPNGTAGGQQARSKQGSDFLDPQGGGLDSTELQADTLDFRSPLNGNPGRNILLSYSSEEEMGSEKVITLSHRQDQSQAFSPVLCGYKALLDPNLSRLPHPQPHLWTQLMLSR